MDLKDFVAESLAEIIEGTKEAQLQAKAAGAVIYPDFPSTFAGAKSFRMNGKYYPVQTVSFDVLVTASQAGKAKGGIAVVSGLLNAGVQGGTESANGTASRIQFSVPIVFPAQD